MTTTLVLGCAAGLVLALATIPARADTSATLANLQKAFEGESNASHRYAAFAKKAEQEGEKQAARLFKAAAKAESIHAAKHKKTIESLGGKAQEVKLAEVQPGSTKENLEASIKGESEERDVMYPGFIKQAETDNAPAAVTSFTWAVKAEAEHAKLYAEAVKNLGKGLDTGYSVCPRCGNTLPGEATQDCVVCDEPAKEFLAF